MPVYVYVCDKCGVRLEELEPISTPSGTTHPCECGGTLKRVPANFGFNFNCPMPTYRKGQ